MDPPVTSLTSCTLLSPSHPVLATPGPRPVPKQPFVLAAPLSPGICSPGCLTSLRLAGTATSQ